MIRIADAVTDLMLMLGINNLAFLMLLVGAIFFIPEPIDAIAATLPQAIELGICTLADATELKPLLAN
jgi:hypothetical protein